MIRAACVQCGLPVAAAPEKVIGDIFCCHGCRIAAAIVGAEAGGDQAWRLLRLGAAGLVSMAVMMIALLLYTERVEPEAVVFFRFVMMALSGVALAVSLPPFVAGAAAEIRNGRIAVDTLVVGGAVAAFGVSAVNTVTDAGPVYYDTATMLPVFLAFGRLIEMSARETSTRLLQSLDELLPASALLIADDGTMREVPPAALRPGDLIRVRPGERVAADGRIEDGASHFAEAHLTGEPLPRFRAMGDDVAAGAVNGPQSVLVRVVRVGDDLFISRIAESVLQARLQPSGWDRIAERVAGIFVPLMLGVAVAAAGGWWLSGSPQTAVTAFLSVLVAACPCALGIATPLATVQAISVAARNGVIVRGGDILERVGSIDLLFLDKTGTLTSGYPEVARIVTLDAEQTEEEIILWAATLEAGTGHVFARALLTEATRRGLTLGGVRDLALLSEGGVSALVTIEGQSRRVTVGRMAGSPVGAGETGFDIAWGGITRGRIFLSDRLRPEVPDVVSRLRQVGVDTVVLSGDNHDAVAALASRAGIQRFEPQRTPADKAALVTAARAAGKKVGCAGDGVNDASALAAAGVGIALGGGADLTRLAGDVVLVSDTIAPIPWLIDLSRRTRRIIISNLLWTFCYNSIAVTAAAAGKLHPLLAAAAMVVSSLCVVANSSRLRKMPEASL